MALSLRYRVLIKYCVFPEIFVIFLNSASSAAALVFYLVCVHTLTLRENRERQESRIFLNIRKTQYLIKTLYVTQNDTHEYLLFLQIGGRNHNIGGIDDSATARWLLLRPRPSQLRYMMFPKYCGKLYLATQLIHIYIEYVVLKYQN